MKKVMNKADNQKHGSSYDVKMPAKDQRATAPAQPGGEPARDAAGNPVGL